MLQSIPYVKKEYSFSYSNEGWKGMLAKAVNLSDPPAPLAGCAPASSPSSSPEVSISDVSDLQVSSSEDSCSEEAHSGDPRSDDNRPEDSADELT
ncbi:MAG: hypothetical protein ACRD51_13230, partial [Candidatus Acidiferrum sp.]